CHMPYTPFWLVWKPHRPEVLYSHIGLAEMLKEVLPGWRTGAHPPLFPSNLQGTRSPLDGPEPEARMPRSSVPFGMMSASIVSRTPLLFRSSPRMLVTVGVPAIVVPGTNMDEKVTTTSGRSMTRLRFRSRSSRPPAAKSVE